MIVSEVRSVLSEGTIKVGPQNEGFFTYYLLDSQEKWGIPFYHEPKAAEPIDYLHKVQDDYPKTDKGGHSSRTIGSLT